MKHGVLCVLLLAFASVVLVGCGGGGGTNPPPPPSSKFVLTGTVKDYQTGASVQGAKVTIGAEVQPTDAYGRFRLEFDTRPMVTTYSIDGTSAGPCPDGYYRFWAQADGKAQDGQAIELPLAPAGGMDLGMIYLWNADSPPPPMFPA